MGVVGRVTIAAVLGAVLTVGQCWLLAMQAVPTTFTAPVVPGATYPWPAPVPANWPACEESVRWWGIGMRREQASEQNAYSSRVPQFFVTRDVLGWPMGAMESVRCEYLPLSGAGAIRVEDVSIGSGIRVHRGSGPGAFESFLPMRPMAMGFTVNVLLYTLVAFGVLSLVARWRASRRKRDGECAACGYELAGLRTCAECGKVNEPR